MGFDLHGISPSGTTIPEPDWKIDSQVQEYFALQQNIAGAYFRNNVWWWHPLWAFVCSTCDDILDKKDMCAGESNSGQLISGNKSLEIGLRLKKLLRNDVVVKYIEERDEKLKNLPQIKCTICNGTGTRKAFRGWESKSKWLKYHTRLGGDSTSMQCSYAHANGCNGCNSCQGTGEVDNWATHYHLSEENVEEFARFCVASGGFTIS